jgi:GxxExxY protein
MKDIEDVGREIVDSAIKIHRALGPGLLESAYQSCLIYELTKRGLKVEHEILLPVHYDGHLIQNGYRVDMFVEDCVIIENKCVDVVLPVHEAQLLTYLKLKNCRLGFLLNWRVNLMKHGIKRMAYGY